MRALTERTVSFDHDYPMWCSSCDEVTTVSAQDYFEQVGDCHVECAKCGDDVHFGPAAAALGDPTEVSVSNAEIGQLAWYHTSTADMWPLSQRPPMGPSLLAGHMPAEVLDRARRRHADQALHVGTFEAAIESMLRRMRDQDDGSSQFFLYRIALRSDITVEPGYRDENHVEAAQITQSQIREAGFLAIRYLNVHEAMGSLSLAVCREAIETVQASPLPPPELSTPLPDDLVATVEAMLPRIRPTNHRRERLSLGQEHTLEQYRLANDLRQRIAGALLGEVSPVVRRNLVDAMHCWEDSQGDLTARALLSRWSAVSALLTRPDDVIGRLSRQPTRSVV